MSFSRAFALTRALERELEAKVEVDVGVGGINGLLVVVLVDSVLVAGGVGSCSIRDACRSCESALK